MRKELGKPTRELFFALLDEAAPEFHRCNTYDTIGLTWSFLRRQSELRQWIIFQQHRYHDAFTVELSWSCVKETWMEPPMGEPKDPFARDGCRFRLGAFWEPQGDHWWHVTEPMSPEELVEKVAQGVSEKVDVQEALPRVRAESGDAIERIREHALPYFEQVAEWAARQT